MNNERLKEIKENYNFETLGEFVDAKLVSPYDLKFLIEQAEILKNLDKYTSTVTNGEFIPEEYIDILERQNKRYREALEEIAEGVGAPELTALWSLGATR